ncbi:cutinase domain-containing protein [Hirsutella rhossiliensis]|uniref:Cutinase domain-containing protein n=1 Tax=Hirsutella rhossiliensis TaxID=111463 RepID=A0A9P8SMB8_9HYPO|nr:cutinase domain-containing protein [Hirsutella rhossiliensis]KAH0968403.1 cutinase domain-containing protein [Hirsutella rhossiliensis]
MRGNVASTLALMAGVAAAAAHNSSSTCAAGLYLIVARGTSELKGAGISGPLADRVAEHIKGSTVVPLDYPATLTNPIYDDSVGDGVDALQEAVHNYTQSCPDAKVALMGYSQGAQLTTDALCGGTGAGFESAKPLSADLIRKNIVAIVLFGDPSHVINTRYDKGTSVKNGVFERNNATVRVCETYSDRMVSYCDTGDVFCDNGQDKKVHSSYIKRYGDDALKFIVDRYNKAAKSTGGTNLTSSSTASGGTATAAPTASSTGSTGASGGSSAATPAATGAGGGNTSAASGLVAGGSVYLALSLVMAAALQAL